jgi:hypothetical protein
MACAPHACTTCSLVGDDSVPLKLKRIDEGGIDGDLCCLVMTEDLSVVCMVWPTAGKLKQLKTMAEVGGSSHVLVPCAHVMSCGLWPTAAKLKQVKTMAEVGSPVPCADDRVIWPVSCALSMCSCHGLRAMGSMPDLLHASCAL